MKAVRNQPTPVPVVVELTAIQARARLHDALGIYVAAMNYPRGTEHHRAPMWSEHISRLGWRAVAALSTARPDSPDPATDPMVAIAYGYHGAPHQWWHQQVAAGLRRSDDRNSAQEVLASYFELTELHVHPDMQGHGLGESLLVRLLDGRPERRVLLSTPEVDGEDNRAWRLYRRFGFEDVIRRFTFAGDNRPFAVLGRTLPLPSDIR